MPPAPTRAADAGVAGTASGSGAVPAARPRPAPGRVAPLAALLARGHVQGGFFLAGVAIVEIAEEVLLASRGFESSAQGLGGIAGEGLEVLEEHADMAEPATHAGDMAQLASAATKTQTIEAVQDAQDKAAEAL